MKINCKAIKLSIEITIISLILLIIFQILYIKINYMIIDILTQIDLGIFSSSVITIFFYTSAYKIEKRKLLENYWNEIRKILINFEKVEYMDIDFKEDVLVGYIHEKSRVWIQQYNKMKPENAISEDLKNTNLIKIAIKKENKEIIDQLSKEGQKQVLNEKLEKIYYNTVKKIDKITGQYLEFLDYSIEELNCILGDMEFFTGEENYLKAYKLYKNIYELRLKIRNSARHFRYYKEGKGNKAIVLSEILELQKNIFRVEENKKRKMVYNEFIDEMNKELEEFRSEVIYGVETEKYEKIPILEIVKR